VKANLSIDDLDEETVDGPAAGRDLLEYSGAFLLPFDRDADAFQLSLKADLKKMKRVRVTLVDPATGRPTYMEVSLSDTVDGKTLTGYVPYYFLAKKQQENVALTKDVKLITIK
jgi:hypothetical protein